MNFAEALYIYNAASARLILNVDPNCLPLCLRYFRVTDRPKTFPVNVQLGHSGKFKTV